MDVTQSFFASDRKMIGYTTAKIGVINMADVPKQSNAAENGAPKIERLVDSVTYQTDSIVSREIIRKSTGTVTLFAFDKGQGLSEHTAPFDALVYIVEGEADVTISGQAYHLEQGQTVILPANKPHALAALSQFKMLLVMIRS
jgi:quercetin dioxygenase-like cupin family protein